MEESTIKSEISNELNAKQTDTKIDPAKNFLENSIITPGINKKLNAMLTDTTIEPGKYDALKSISFAEEFTTAEQTYELTGIVMIQDIYGRCCFQVSITPDVDTTPHIVMSDVAFTCLMGTSGRTDCLYLNISSAAEVFMGNKMAII